MIVVGVDLGVRKAAVAVLDGDELQVMTIEVDSAFPRSEQLQQVAAFVEEIVLVHRLKPMVIYVEEPLVGRGVRASLQIAQTAGAVLAAMGAYRISTYLVPVDSWKKATVGKGGVSKEKISEWLDELHPCYSSQCDGDQDRIDATCIALYGRQQQLVATRLLEDFDYRGA